MIGYLIEIAIALAVVGGLIAGLVAIGNVIPTSFIQTAISAAGGYLHILYGIFPNTTQGIVTILLALLAIETFFGVYKITKWVWSKIPGIN